MKVDFRDICGNSYNLEIPNNADVAEACKCLSQKTGIQENEIFLVSTNSMFNFYQDNERMVDILNENPEFIIFIKAFANERYSNQKITNQDFNENSDKFSKDTNYSQSSLIGKCEPILNRSLKHPQKSFFNSIQSAKNWRYNDIYDDYSYVVNEVPHDIQIKIDQLAELGYHIEDIKEALRATNYKVSLAIHFLMLHHATNDNNFDYYSDDNYIYDSENENDNSDIEYFDYAFNDNEQIPHEKVDSNSPNEKANNDTIPNEKTIHQNDSTEGSDFNSNSNEKSDDKLSNENFNESNEKINKNEEKKSSSENTFSFKKVS